GIACSLLEASFLRNSVCLSTSNEGTALFAQSASEAEVPRAVNSTAIAPQGGSTVGILATPNGANEMRFEATNTIAYGSTDVFASAAMPGAKVTIVMAHSNFDTQL